MIAHFSFGAGVRHDLMSALEQIIFRRPSEVKNLGKIMKSIQMKNLRPFGYKSIGALALLSGIWFSSTISSFGDTTIGLSSGSTSPNCSGSVNVEGSVTCDNDCEANPVVTVNPGSHTPSVDGSCSHGIFYGTWASTSVSLSKGVNVITSSDDCDSTPATLKVTSNGGSGPSIEWSGTPEPCSEHLGFESTLKVCCLTPGQPLTSSGTYSISESISVTGNCPNHNSSTSWPNPVYHGTDSDGCFTQVDYNDSRPPGFYFSGNGETYCNCSSAVIQTITITGPDINQTFTDYGNFSYGACPSGKPAKAILHGDAIGGSVTNTCN